VVLQLPRPAPRGDAGDAGGAHGDRRGPPREHFVTLRIARVEELAPCDAAGILDGSSDLTGLMLWPAAEAMAQMIAAEPARWRGKSVLELGAGVVMITDGEDEAVEMIQHNINVNKDVLPEGRVRCSKLNWTPEDLGVWKEKEGCAAFDVILGSDIIYSFDALDPLFRVVDSLLAQATESHFLVMYSSRGKRLDAHLPVVAGAHNFDFELEAYCPQRQENDAGDVEPMYLCTFKRKRMG